MKARNIGVAAVVFVLVSVALARNEFVVYLDYGAPWVSSQEQEVLLVSTTPVFGATGEAASAQAPHVSPPPLVPCEDAAEGTPCVEIVTEVDDIVGMWRRYYAGASAMAFTEFREDGTLSIVQSLPGDARVTGTIHFEDGVAAFAANPDGPAAPECKAPGRYELRLIRIGEQPVALSFSLVGEDGCIMRVDDFSMPMIHYTGSGEELVMNPDAAALAQPLVPCPEEGDEAYPCEVLATQPEDIAGVWKQYLGNPMLAAPGGMGYIRYTRDGTSMLADTPENTAAPYPPYPRARYAFENGTLIMAAEGEMVPPECRTARYELRVYRLGQQPVALFYTPIEDDCVGRRMDLRYPLVWVASAD